MSAADYSRRYVDLLAAGAFDIPAATQKVSRLIADHDYDRVPGAAREAIAVLQETVRLVELATPEQEAA